MSQPADLNSLKQRQTCKHKELAKIEEELRLTKLAQKFHGEL